MQEILTVIKNIVNFIKAHLKIFVPLAIAVVLVISILIFRETPINVDGMLQKADNYARKGQIALALEEYNKIVRLFPNNYDVHLRLAEIYTTVNEPEKSKIEYMRAIRLGSKLRYEANIALAELYVKENHFDLAEHLIKLLSDNPRCEAKKKIGDFYYDWADSLKNGDRLEAIRKYKEAVKYYNSANSKTSQNAINQIVRLYGDISDTLLESNEVNNAVEILKISLEYKDTALSHYKLAKIYEKHFTTDMALAEYEAAYKLNPNLGSYISYKQLMLKKAQILAEHGDKVHADFYRMKAKKIDSTVEVPTFTSKKLIFSLIATRVNEDIDRDVLIPGIIFKLTNISKNALTDVKAKVVFMDGGKPFSTKIVTIASDESPLEGDKATQDISVYSDEPVKYVLDDHDLRVQVFLSQSDSSDWKLFKNIKVERNRKSGVTAK